jgi:hypothetical protein
MNVCASDRYETADLHQRLGGIVNPNVIDGVDPWTAGVLAGDNQDRGGLAAADVATFDLGSIEPASRRSINSPSADLYASAIACQTVARSIMLA